MDLRWRDPSPVIIIYCLEIFSFLSKRYFICRFFQKMQRFMRIQTRRICQEISIQPTSSHTSIRVRIKGSVFQPTLPSLTIKKNFIFNRMPIFKKRWRWLLWFAKWWVSWGQLLWSEWNGIVLVHGENRAITFPSSTLTKRFEWIVLQFQSL